MYHIIYIYIFIYPCLWMSFWNISEQGTFPAFWWCQVVPLPLSTCTLTDFDNAPANLWACAWQVSTASLFWALRDQLDDGVHVGVWSTCIHGCHMVPQCTVVQWWLGTPRRAAFHVVKPNQITSISWIEGGRLKHPGDKQLERPMLKDSWMTISLL